MTPSRRINTMKYTSKTGFFTGDSRAGHCYDKHLAKALLPFLQGSVIDIGCGGGEYVKFFTEQGIEIQGVDGNPHTNSFNSMCRVVDLSDRISLGCFNQVISLEVGEQIPSKYEDNFIWNIANQGAEELFISWAIPGQGGIGHVNCRTNTHVRRVLFKYGYSRNQEVEELLREKATLPWFKNTLMSFRKRKTFL